MAQIVGDQVSEGDLLAEIETDKATWNLKVFKKAFYCILV